MRFIYHGSRNVIQKPKFGFGKPYNDYGLGFYATENEELAKEWAVNPNENGYVNKYVIEDTDLSILYLNQEKYNVLHWLTILLENRQFDIASPLGFEAKEYLIKHFHIDYKKFDIIIGYRADDSYFSFAQDFLNGTISYRQLSKAMKLGELGEQYVLKSKKAFDSISFLGFEEVSADNYYPKRSSRDAKARKDYFDSKKNHREKGDLYITNILDEEMKKDDPRLR